MAGGLFGGGTGTAEDPYLVEDLSDLNAIRNNLSAHYLMIANIDAHSTTTWDNGLGWEPIGSSVAPFTGTLDGDGHVIDGLYINRTSSNSGTGFMGFFSGSISKLGLTNVDITGAGNTGALMGVMATGLVTSSYVTGNLTAFTGSFQGGFVGQFSGGNINDCYSAVNINGREDVGGFVGRSARTLSRCYSRGFVSASLRNPGGLTGLVVHPGGDSYCYYDTESSGQSDTGNGKGEPKTTAEMKTRTTYENWDFASVWLINTFRFDGYPYFAWQEYIDQEYIPNYPPQSYVELNFTAGDSTPYPMGRFFIDRTQSAVGRETVSIQARNSIGKYIKDQSFDERHYYPTATLKTLLEQILLAAGITNYHVANNSTQVGMEFPPNMDMLTGIQELLKLTPGWIIREEVSGKVVIGPRNDVNFTQPSKYTFYRDQDIFSRESIKDDNDAYGRVCCHTADYSVRVYRPVPSTLGWLPPAQKTLYVQVPDGTRSAEAASLAVELAEQLANSGEVETFVGPYRPHLIPGDQAEIIDADGPNLLGVITTVEHAWSKGGQGFITGITVDSGGKIGKPQLREFIDALTTRQRTGAVKL